MIEISAPGKLILCGEHAVVYGKKALACATNLRTHLKAQKTINITYFIINFNDINEILTIDKNQFNTYSNVRLNDDDERNNSIYTKSLKPIILMFNLLQNELTWQHLSGMHIEIHSQIPVGAGLGSSAALAACLAAFFLKLLNKSNDLVLVNECAFQIEKLFHGRPSGIDNSVAIYGGFVLYENGQIGKKFVSNDIRVLVVDTGVPKDTKQQVANVRKLYERHMNVCECLMNGIDGLVDKFVKLLDVDKQSERDETVRIALLEHPSCTVYVFFTIFIVLSILKHLKSFLTVINALRKLFRQKSVPKCF